MFKRHKRAAIAIAAVIVAALSASIVYAAASAESGDGAVPGTASIGPTAATGSCKTGRTDYATQSITHSTTSTTYINLIDGTVAFRQAGRTPKCVIVEFSSMAFAGGNPGEVMFVRAVLDGTVVGDPADTQFSGDDDEDVDNRWARTQAAQFAFASVAPGNHTIQIQFRSNFGGIVALRTGLASVAHA
jgi:hypothetical protein